MEANTKTQLELFVRQGKAMKDLLVKTNIHGKHDGKIQKISMRIAGAQKRLARMK